MTDEEVLLLRLALEHGTENIPMNVLFHKGLTYMRLWQNTADMYLVSQDQTKGTMRISDNGLKILADLQNRN